ncbi:hypothetical protein ACHAXH_002331 [Discostella pseudostelligera]
MILNIHSDASYLSETKARSRLGGTFFMGSLPINGSPIQLNGPILIAASICKFVVALAAKAELDALFYNCQDGTVLRLALEELGHVQPPTPVHCDNSTAVSIANDTVKKQRSRAMEKNFFWTVDQVALGNFNVTWHPGQENLADYFTKHFNARNHQLVRPYYFHMPTSPLHLPRALAELSPTAIPGAPHCPDYGQTHITRTKDVHPWLRATHLPQPSHIRVHNSHQLSDRKCYYSVPNSSQKLTRKA